MADTPAQLTAQHLADLGWTLTRLSDYDDHATMAYRALRPDMGSMFVAIRPDGSHKFYRHLKSPA